MKKSVLKMVLFSFALSTGLAIAIGSLFAQDRTTTPLSSTETVKDLMKTYKTVFRSISTSVTTSKFDEKLLADIESLKKLSETSKDLIPESFDNLSEDHRQHLIVLYKEELQKFIAELDVLKAAVIAKDTDAAKLSLKNLSALKQSSHDSFEKP